MIPYSAFVQKGCNNFSKTYEKLNNLHSKNRFTKNTPIYTDDVIFLLTRYL